MGRSEDSDNLTGERLREQRQELDLTIKEVAERQGVSPSYISELERGANRPNVWPLLSELARQLNTSTDYLLGLTDEPASCKEREALLPEAWELQVVLRQLPPELRADIVTLAKAMLKTSWDGVPRVFASDDVVRPGHLRLLGTRPLKGGEEGKYDTNVLLLPREERRWIKAGERVIEFLEANGCAMRKRAINRWMEFVIYQGLSYSQPRYYEILYYWLSQNLKDGDFASAVTKMREILGQIEQEDFTDG